MTLKIIMQNEKPNQKRMHIVWFHLIKFQKIPSIFTEKEKKKKKRGVCTRKRRWEEE